MAYDPTKTKQLLKLVVYFSNHPQGEVVTQLAAQLKAAEDEIIDAAKRALEALNRAERAEKELRDTNLLLLTRRPEIPQPPPAPPEETGI